MPEVNSQGRKQKVRNPMKNGIRLIFWIEIGLASLTAFLAVATNSWPDWIERVFHIDLDYHSGSAEWKLVSAFWLTTVLFAGLALREWRKASLAIRNDENSGSTP